MTPLFWLAISVAAVLAILLALMTWAAEDYRLKLVKANAELSKSRLSMWRYLELKKYLIAHDFKIKMGKHFINLDMVKKVNMVESSFPSHTTDKKPGE